MIYQCTFCDIERDNFFHPDFEACKSNKHMIIKIEELPEEFSIYTVSGGTKILAKWMTENMKEEIEASNPVDPIEIPGSEILDKLETIVSFEVLQEIVKNALYIAICNIKGEKIAKTYKKLTPKVDYTINIKMHQLGTGFEGKIVKFNAIIYGVDEEGTYYTKAICECPICGDSAIVYPDLQRRIDIPKCKQCKKTMEINMDLSVTEAIQHIMLEEPLEEAINANPSHKHAEIVGELVKGIYIGEKVQVTGVYRSIYNIRTKRNNILIDVLDIKPMEKTSEVLPTQEEIDRYKDDSKKEDFVQKIIDSFTDKIGMEEVKLSILLSLVGGRATGKMDRGDINVVIMGDPSVAKSQLLIFGQKITPGSRFVSGHSATGAGVVGGIGEVEGRRMYMAGAMSLCSGSHLFIDELDKMGREHMDKMHEAMEKQTISGDYVGINITLPAKTPIIAAANPKNSIYDPNFTIQQNFNIKPSLQSRFDLKWLVRDNKDEYQLSKIAKYITRPHDKKTDLYMTPTQLSAYINYVKKLEPKFTDEASDVIENFWLKAKKAKKTTDGLAVDFRTLEALMRIAFAFAKLQMHETVTKEDAVLACNLMYDAYKSWEQDLETGVLKQSTLTGKRVKEESAMWHALEEKVKQKNDLYLTEEEISEALVPVFGVFAMDHFRDFVKKHGTEILDAGSKGWKISR